MTSIYPFQTQEVRDLAWACFSPSLLLTAELAGDSQLASNCALGLNAARRAWLERLDRDSSLLLEHLSSQRSHRLGVYFEHLWHFFLSEDPAVELVTHNLPIHHQGRTLGEFDCIYYCHQRQRHVHLELAVKYFLGHRQAGSNGATSYPSEWLGPNSADRLDLKTEHLMQRQIRLGDNAVARERLLELGIHSLLREVEIKGYLFQSLADPLPPPPGFNPQRELETWLTVGRLGGFLRGCEARRYLLLPRMRWLSGAVQESAERALSARQLATVLTTELTADARPQLVAGLDQAGRESHRFFVTGPDWPAPWLGEPVRQASGAVPT